MRFRGRNVKAARPARETLLIVGSFHPGVRNPRMNRLGRLVGALSALVLASLVSASTGCGSSRSAYDDERNGASSGNGNGKNGNGSLGANDNVDSGEPAGGGGGCEKMDIVFVIDNSGSMGEEQENLATNFPKFVSVLDSTTTSSGTPLDYRVAVTTTGKSYRVMLPFGFSDEEKGDDGAFRNNCGGSQRWLEKAEAATSFPCRAKVGTSGPSEEMPLECMKLALNDRIADGTNAGFLRDDALLAVVFLTDEDDCSFSATTLDEGFGDLCEDNASAEKPESYVTFLDDLKHDRGRWATAVIAGKTDCQSSFGNAAEAKRLGQFVTETGKNAVFSSICDGDLSKSLEQAIAKFGEACKSFPTNVK